MHTPQLIGIIFSLRQIPSPFGSCSEGLFYKIVLDTFPIFVMVAVYEVVIYPFFKAIIPSMLKRIGIGMVVGILALLALLALNSHKYNTSTSSTITSNTINASNGTQCNLLITEDNNMEDQVNISLQYIAIVLLMAALAETLVFIAGKYYSYVQC